MSDSSDDDTAKAISYLTKLAEVSGVACSTVKDGHFLIFKRAYLKDLIEKNENETLAIFIKRAEFKN